MPYSTDIYSTREAIDDLKREFIEEESSETLELSTYGFLGASLAKMTSATIRVASEKANEVFYSKARLQSSIYMHSKQNEINVTATPAYMNILLCLVEEDINRLFEAATDNFIVIDSACIFKIGDYEYHLDYPIIISKRTMINNKTVYTARYDISDVNKLSNVVNPYLPSPYLIKNNGYTYLYIACTLRQVIRSIEYSKLVTSSVIDNKTYEFTYDKNYQLANFDIYVTEGENTIRLFPYYEGESVGDETHYCWYQYIDAYTIRIKFDAGSYMPGINSEISTVIYTTEGAKCNMSYTKTILQNLSDTDKYVYDGIQVMIIPQNDSVGGVNAPSLTELKKKLPKEALSRGSISNEKDLENFLNRFSTDYIRTKSLKKVDNQLMRSYFVYILAKDNDQNVVPTNTINLITKDSDFDELIMDETTDTPVQYILKQGCYIGYNKGSHFGEILKNPTEEDLKAYDFIYTIPFKAVISKEGPYISYLMTVMNNDYMTYFSYINDYTPLQFICSGVKWNRTYNGDNSYSMQLSLTQNIASEMGVLTADELGNITSNLKVIVMCYNADGKPYRYFFGEMEDYDIEQTFSYLYNIKFETNDIVNENNYIRIENGYAVNQDTVQYGYFPSNTQAKIYVLCKFKDAEGYEVEYGRYDLDDFIGGLEGYSCTNVYDVLGGIDFFDNFTKNITSTVTINEDEGFKIMGVPVIKRSYATKEDKFLEFVSNLKDIKRFIDDEATELLEGMGIDLKFYNTYGPARLYTIDGKTPIDRVNVSLKFNLSLRKASDDYTREYIRKDIKTDIESLDNNESYHLPVLISDMNKTYENSIYYLEFRGFNDYGSDYQHFYASESEDVSDVPEFICINQLDDGSPDITISIVE